MSKPEDLLGRADALLKRYHPAGAAGQTDVPVLTEVITDPAAHAQPAASTATQNAPARIDLTELEQRLKQSILEAIGPHVAKVVEEPLRARLDAHLQRALATLSAQVKSDLEALIRDAVARAVEAEIERTRGPSRGG
jgi:uncharacterized membrane-anchored protein YjiN (DUF445 family)